MNCSIVNSILGKLIESIIGKLRMLRILKLLKLLSARIVVIRRITTIVNPKDGTTTEGSHLFASV